MISRNAIEERIQNWQSKMRKAREDEASVTFHAGVFNESWLWLGVIFTLLALVTGQPGLMAIAAALFTIIPVAWLWNRVALWGVHYERSFDVTRAFPGEVVEMTVRMTNLGPVPIPWVRVVDPMPPALPVKEQGLVPIQGSQTAFATTWALRWFERVTRRYHLFCTQRGHYLIGPAEMLSGDAFALFTTRREQARTAHLVVFPEIYPLADLGLPEKDPFGVRTAHERLFEDPARTRGVRDLQPDDSIRYVHWKASARHSKLQVRMFEPTADMQLVVFLNVTTMPRHWQGHIPEIFERAVSVAASVAQYAIDQAWRVGLMANGVAPHSDQALKVLPSRSPDQIARLLTALASVTSFPSAAIETMLAQECPRLPWGATIVVVTGVVYEELCATLLRLRDAGRRVVLISIAEEPPPEVPGVPTYHSGSDVLAFRSRPKPVAVEATLDAIPSPVPCRPPDDWQEWLYLGLEEEADGAPAADQ